MFRPSNLGLGNILIQLCHVKSVSSKIYDGRRGEYIRVKDGIQVIEDDGTLPAGPEPRIYLQPTIHCHISDIIEPTEHAKTYIDKYRHLVDGVEFGLQIRRGMNSSSKNVNCVSAVHCDETALRKFFHIMDTTSGNVFLSSDCVETKRLFYKMYGNKVRFVDEQAILILNETIDDPWASFTDFFLLSMCPFIYMTGGARDLFTFSTFGYMAAMYGKKPFEAVMNDAYESINPSAT